MTTPTTNIRVIEVDLGCDINQIISDDLTQLTTQNREAIDAAITANKQMVAVRTARDEAEKHLIEATTSIFQLLIDADARNETVAAKTLLTQAQPHITNMISLVQRLKAHIKTNNLPYQLKKMTQNRESYYYLETAEVS